MTATPLREATVLAAGLRLHHVACGRADAPLLLFLHGFPEHCLAWRRVLPAFAARWHAVALDLPGYGRSDKPTELKAYRAGAIAGVIEAFVRALGHERCVLVGHDWGGAIGWYLAATRPSLVAGLVAINAVHPNLFAREFLGNPAQREASRYIGLFRQHEAEARLSEQGFAYLRGMFEEDGAGPPAWLDAERLAEYERAWSAPGALGGGLAYYRASPAVDAPGAAAVQAAVAPLRVQVPVLVIWGERDRFLLPGNLQGLDALVPRLRVERLPHASHWVVHEETERVTQLIADFVDALPARHAPLRGLRVLEFGQFIAVPAAAQTLRDLGAEVIKVEPPAGDAARSTGWTRDAYGPMFTAFNRGKQSVVLDLRTQEGREAAHRLAATADVLLQNMRPGTMEKLGLGADALLAHKPSLVYGRVSGFGQRGVDSSRPGLDIAAQAESGMMSLNGPAGAEPTRVGFAAVDAMAAHALATGVLAALVRRGVDGQGGLVDVSLVDVAIEALGQSWADFGLSGKLPLRSGNGQPFAAPAADVFDTADGAVVVSAYMPEHFLRLCAALGVEELAGDARFCDNDARVRNRGALRAALGPPMAGLPTRALCERLAAAGVVVGAVRTMADVRAGQDGVSADLFVDVKAAGRDAVRVPGLAFTMDGVARAGGRLPALGEHTGAVLATLGRTPAEPVQSPASAALTSAPSSSTDIA